MAAALWNFLWMDADSFRVFASGAIYRRKGEVGGCPRAHTTWPDSARGHATLWCGYLGALLHLCFGLRLRVGKNRRFGFCFIQFQEYFLYNFSEIQK
jgi:hypothetical protein